MQRSTTSMNTRNSLRNALRTAHATRSSAGVAYEFATGALARGNAVLADTVKELQAQEAKLATDETLRSEMLAFALTADIEPRPIPGKAKPAVVSALSAARRHATAARALASLESALGARTQELQQAKQGVVQAVDALLLDEAEEIATEILRHEEQAVRLRERLIPLMPATRPVGAPVYPASATVNKALEPPGFFDTSRYFPMAGENGQHRLRIAQHGREWAARRAALLAGEAPSAEEQAA
jgi:hypothetical protein